MKKLLLVILDGLGLRDAKDYNAFALARTPNLDHLVANYPLARLKAHGEAVGLPSGQMGNSEVGHITIGSGRVIMQELPKINRSITDGSLAQQSAIAKLSGKNIHLIGLISDGGVHSHVNHIIALHKILSTHNNVFVHGISDGRDVPPRSVINYINHLNDHGIGLSSIAGRFYAMDRDKRFERTKKYYDALLTNAPKTSDFKKTVQSFYSQDINDEFFHPTISNTFLGINSGDIVITANFRADRMRQLCNALANPNFQDFLVVSRPALDKLITMTPYSEEISSFSDTIFTHQDPSNTLGEIIAQNGLLQLRIAETEKYAHVTYFFNGGKEATFFGEDRVMIPSPKVETYDLKPSMSATELTDALINAMSKEYSLIVANYANCDMVGHSGNLTATIEAVESIDTAVGRLIEACRKHNFEMLITADHGNAEEMYDPNTDQALTSHTLNPVPLIYFGHKKLVLKDGELSDIAPTILKLLNLKKPSEMSGEPLYDND